jgi:8-oxo-dGTP pyrophosphatase MutT (NUDIX family)
LSGASDPTVDIRYVLDNPDSLRSHIRRVLSARTPISQSLPEGFRRAAVLIPLVPAAEGAALLFTMRSELVERHKGQISFPGGTLENGENLKNAALREAYEEVGIPPDDVEILGGLDDEETAVSGFLISPFVGQIPYPIRLRPSPEEVRALLLVPLRVFMDPANCWGEVWERDSRRSVIYFYRAGRDVIWGATGRIIAHFLDVVFGIGPPDVRG